MGRKVRDEGGHPLDATFSTGLDDGQLAIWLESRGGAKGGINERHLDYGRALRLILQRLAALDAVLLDAVVDSSRSGEMGHAEKVLDPGAPLPVALRSLDPETARLSLQRSQRSVGHRALGTGSGNNTRRIKLLVHVPSMDLNPTALEDDLACGLLADRPVPDDLVRAHGQGFASDPRSRKAVEDRAMALTLAHLQGEGWDVEDVHLRESFDYTARRNGVELHVEVKGLVGSLKEVLITVNERRHAERWPDLALAIATNIKVDRSGGEVVAQGGDLEVISPWRIEDGDLVATQYRWKRRA